MNRSHEIIGEGNGTPLQYSCLENPRNGGAWWAAVYGVTQSQAQLEQLSSSSSSTYQTLWQVLGNYREQNRGIQIAALMVLIFLWGRLTVMDVMCQITSALKKKCSRVGRNAGGIQHVCAVLHGLVREGVVLS